MRLPKATEGDPEKSKDGYHAVPPTFQSVDPYIHHPHINNIGNPPKVNTIDFERWQLEFRSYMCRSCNEQIGRASCRERVSSPV